jgi:hypothetical protein
MGQCASERIDVFGDAPNVASRVQLARRTRFGVDHGSRARVWCRDCSWSSTAMRFSLGASSPTPSLSGYGPTLETAINGEGSLRVN